MSCEEEDEDSQGSEMEDNRVIYRRAMLSLMRVYVVVHAQRTERPSRFYKQILQRTLAKLRTESNEHDIFIHSRIL